MQEGHLRNHEQRPGQVLDTEDRVRLSDIRQQLSRWCKQKKSLLLLLHFGKRRPFILLRGHVIYPGFRRRGETGATFDLEVPKHGRAQGLRFSRFNEFIRGKIAERDATYIKLARRRNARTLESVTLQELEGPFSEERLLSRAQAQPYRN
jgi:hypothetical protein